VRLEAAAVHGCNQGVPRYSGDSSHFQLAGRSTLSNHFSTKALFLNSAGLDQIITGLGDQGVAGSSPVSPTFAETVFAATRSRYVVPLVGAETRVIIPTICRVAAVHWHHRQPGRRRRWTCPAISRSASRSFPDDLLRGVLLPFMAPPCPLTGRRNPSIQVGRLSLGNSPSPGAHTGTQFAPVARLGLLCSSGPRRPCWTSEANQSA
jgi:hypothetical protein